MREVASRLEKSGSTMLLVESQEEADRARKLHSCSFCFTVSELSQRIKEKGVLSGLKNVVTNCRTFPFASRISGSLWLFTSAKDSTIMHIPQIIGDQDIFLDRNSDEPDVDFVETSAYQSARTTLISHGHVTLTGEAGSGKTTIALELLRENKHNCNPVIVKELENLTALKCSKVPTLVLVDDMFGHGVFVSEYFTDMIETLQELEKRMKTKNFKLILTSRNHVFREAMNCLTKKMDFVFSYNTTVDLSSEKTLSVLDKSALLDVYLDSAGVNKNTVNRDAIVNMKTTFSFPLACFMFSQMPLWHSNALVCFSEALPVYNHQVQQLQHFDPGKFTALLLVLLKGTLNIEYLQSGDVDLNKALNFSGTMEANRFLQDLGQLLNALCGSFLRRDGDNITFRNETVAGAISFVAGSSDPCFVVTNCSLDTLYDRIIIQSERVIDIDLYHITLPEQEMQVLADRFTSEIIQGSFALICTQQVCTNKKFVEDVMEAVLTHTEGLTALKNEDISYSETFLHWTVVGGSQILLENLLRKVSFEDAEIQDAILVCCIAGHAQQLDMLLSFQTQKKIALNEKFTRKVAVLKKGTLHFRLRTESVEDETLLDIAHRNGHNDIKDVLRKYGIFADAVVDIVEASKGCRDSDIPACLITEDSVYPFYMEGTQLHLQLENDTSMEDKDENGDTLLHRCIAGGVTEMTELLLAVSLVYGKRVVFIKNNSQETALHIAALTGYEKIVQKLLDHGSIVNTVNYQRQTPLHYACGKGRSNIVQILLENGAIINTADDQGQTPIHLAACWGESETVKFLMESGADGLTTDKQKQTPLHLAAFNGQTDVLTLLLKHKEAVNARDINGYTPLHIAVKNGDLSAVKLLLPECGDINAGDNSSKTPLQIAVLECQYDTAKLLLKNKASVNAVDSCGLTALHMAAYNGSTEIIQLLLKGGAKADTPTNLKLTPLHISAQQGNTEAVLELLACGADVNCWDVNSHSALHFAIQGKHLTVSDLLLSHNADTNIRDKRGESVLHWATRSGDINILKLLCAKQAKICVNDDDETTLELVMKYDVDVNIKNSTGQTALHMAAILDACEALEIFIDNFGDINCEDDSGRTPLHEAVSTGTAETVKMLLDNRADVHAVDLDGQTALQIAAHRGETQIVSVLLKERALMDTKADIKPIPANITFEKWKRLDEQEHTYSRELSSSSPLHTAVAEGHLEIANILIASQSDTETRDIDGQTAVHVAVRKGNTDMLAFLLTKRVNVNAIDNNQQTPAHLAARLGDHESLQMLLQNDADMTRKDEKGMTPLHLAAWCGTPDTVQVLLRRKADVSDKDKKGRIPLHLASQKGQTQITKRLLEAGSDINAVDDDKRTALHLGAVNGERDTIQLLIEHSGDVNATDKGNETPLHLATRRERDDNMKQLLLNGANVDAKNSEGITPLHIAVVGNDKKCVGLLLEYQADVNAKSETSQTPMHIAAREGRPTVVQMLIENKAEVDATDIEGKIPLELTPRNRTAQIILTYSTGTVSRTMKREERLSGSSSSSISCV